MIDNFKLTPHFSFYEATASRDHPGLVDQNRKEAMIVLPKLVMLANLLEEIRWALQKPMEIHSWYRCPALNKAVGGVPTSQHQNGEAADWSPIGPDTYDTIEAAHVLALNQLVATKKMWGEFIVEHGKRHGRKHWIHLSLGYPIFDLNQSRDVWRYEAGIYKHLVTLDRAPWR